MKDTNKDIDRKLLEAQVAINNARTDGEIKQYLTEYGYDEARLAAGKSLLNSASQLHQTQKRVYAEKVGASKDFSDSRKEANGVYINLIKLSRIALQEDYAAYLKLGLAGGRKTNLSGWLVQARQFYDNALKDTATMAKLKKFGGTQAKIEAGKALIETVERKKQEKEIESGEAQQATVERDMAVEELQQWMRNFKAIARIALEDKPQLLEKLGILIRS
jgi:hypothetical protein